jgi:hypothetical protein
MTNKTELFEHLAPRVGGEFIKIKKTGEVVKWQEFDPRDQVFKFESSGEIHTVHQRDTDIATGDEELDYLKKHISK